jgi:hypothetical protein
MIFTKRDKRTELEKEIAAVLEEMRNTDRSSDKYAKLLTHLKGLNTIWRSQRSCRVSPDTWALIGGNLAGLVMIMTFEKTDAIVTKAIQFVLRGRV